MLSVVSLCVCVYGVCTHALSSVSESTCACVHDGICIVCIMLPCVKSK